eukprot:848310-Prorocentrum_minimum.AAC.2
MLGGGAPSWVDNLRKKLAEKTGQIEVLEKSLKRAEHTVVETAKERDRLKAMALKPSSPKGGAEGEKGQRADAE